MHNVEHREFSSDTADLLNQHLKKINKQALSDVIEFNQEDIWDQRFTTQFDLKSEIEKFGV